MINDEISWSYRFTLRAKSLRLVTHSILDSKNPVQLHLIHSFAAKPTGMSQAWNSPPLNPHSGASSCFVQFSPVQWNPQHLITRINPAVCGSFFFFTWMLPWNEWAAVFVFCSVIKLISRDEASQRETRQSLQVNVHTSSSITRKSSVSERQQLLKV